MVSLTGRQPLESFHHAVRSHPYCRESRLADAWRNDFVALAGADGGAGLPAIECVGGIIAVGVVRLDNRHAIAEMIRCPAFHGSDLALATHWIRDRGAEGVQDFIGDFALVLWNADTRMLFAARDAVGVRRLYFRSVGHDQLMLASRAELLADSDRYDLQYLSEAVGCCMTDPARTPFLGVTALPAAFMLEWHNGRLTIGRHWDAHAVSAQASARGTEREQCDTFRELLVDGVRARLSPHSQTWAHLSGGLDSSSVVSVAQRLARTNAGDSSLGGTITFVDAFGTAADERTYSDAVVRMHGVRNVHVSHQVDHEQVLSWLPRIDQPTGFNYSVALRDRQVADIVRGAGGQVLLTGLGGDNLVLGTMFFFADWCATGKAVAAVREMAHRAALGRVSFWKLAYHNAVLPLLPGALRRAALRRSEVGLPPWLTPVVRRCYRLGRRPPLDAYYAGRIGATFAHARAEDVVGAEATLDTGVMGDMLDVRHPFLHKPLVEFALRLAPEMVVRPHAHKWILREAMRGILPEAVRTRVGKGDGSGLNAWALQHNARFIDSLLRDSLLAELGVIEPVLVSTAVGEAGQARERSLLNAMIQRTLDIELWLRVQSGRWTPTASQTLAAAAG
jgi:asparagine synthase (glutamine-hydrolysing)